MPVTKHAKFQLYSAQPYDVTIDDKFANKRVLLFTLKDVSRRKIVSTLKQGCEIATAA